MDYNFKKFYIINYFKYQEKIVKVNFNYMSSISFISVIIFSESK